MNFEAKVVLLGTLSIVAATYLILTIRFLIERKAIKTWKESLNKDTLLSDEKLLNDCLAKHNIIANDPRNIEDILHDLSYTVKESPFMLFRESHTNTTNQEVVIKKNLPPERRHIALAHELMRVICKPNQVSALN